MKEDSRYSDIIYHYHVFNIYVCDFRNYADFFAENDTSCIIAKKEPVLSQINIPHIYLAPHPSAE
jgi:hypothetical protein